VTSTPQWFREVFPAEVSANQPSQSAPDNGFVKITTERSVEQRGCAECDDAAIVSEFLSVELCSEGSGSEPSALRMKLIECFALLPLSAVQLPLCSDILSVAQRLD